jgi:hypothetical protein
LFTIVDVEETEMAQRVGSILCAISASSVSAVVNYLSVVLIPSYEPASAFSTGCAASATRRADDERDAEHDERAEGASPEQQIEGEREDDLHESDDGDA